VQVTVQPAALLAVLVLGLIWLAVGRPTLSHVDRVSPGAALDALRSQPALLSGLAVPLHSLSRTASSGLARTSTVGRAKRRSAAAPGLFSEICSRLGPARV
jgi:type II secretory pathway component PulM